MIALVQRVSRAAVQVAGEETGSIEAGLLVFVCAQPNDTPVQAVKLVDKLLKLRVFCDRDGRMNRSLVDTGGGLLLVSQFTLAADTTRGLRPGFSTAAEPELARRLYERMLEVLRERHPVVQAGRFGADMQVSLVNDGPVTLPLHVD